MAASKKTFNKDLYWPLMIALGLYSVGAGYFAGIQPVGKWRLFSWHPFLMTVAMVGLSGASAVTKKLGGYANTKLHGIFAWLATIVALGGIYAIYENKERNGFDHLKTLHSKVGALLCILMIGLGMFGGAVLHPDFGVDRNNQTFRTIHKLGARLTLIAAWVDAVLGLLQLTSSDVHLFAYGLPLVMMLPLVLI